MEADPLVLARCIVDAVADKQGEDVLLLDIQEVSILADYFVIASAASDRQAEAVIDGVGRETKRALGRGPRRVEGEPGDGWVLMDYGSVVVHLFTPEVRKYYGLEELWSGARVVVRML